MIIRFLDELGNFLLRFLMKRRVAVKVIDFRGNEAIRVADLPG